MGTAGSALDAEWPDGQRFARGEAVNPGTLSFWRWKLLQVRFGRGGQAPAKRTMASGVGIGVSPDPLHRIDFVELMAVSEAADEPAAALELVLSTG